MGSRSCSWWRVLRWFVEYKNSEKVEKDWQKSSSQRGSLYMHPRVLPSGAVATHRAVLNFDRYGNSSELDPRCRRR